MAAGKMCIRKSKEETVEVWHTKCAMITLLSFNLQYLNIYDSCWTWKPPQSAVFCYNGAILCNSLSQQVKWSWTLAVFPPFSYSLDVSVYVPYSGQGCSRMTWKQNKSPLCLWREWWLWPSPPSPTSEGFFQREPTDPDIWRVKPQGNPCKGIFLGTPWQYM